MKKPDCPRFDLVLVDINIPRMNGFEFSDAYLELHPESRGSAPVYIVSGSIDPDDEARAKSHPAISGFIQKPITQESIERIL